MYQRTSARSPYQTGTGGTSVETIVQYLQLNPSIVQQIVAQPNTKTAYGCFFYNGPDPANGYQTFASTLGGVTLPSNLISLVTTGGFQKIQVQQKGIYSIHVNCHGASNDDSQWAGMKLIVNGTYTTTPIVNFAQTFALKTPTNYHASTTPFAAVWSGSIILSLNANDYIVMYSNNTYNSPSSHFYNRGTLSIDRID